jgi:hypothetical protein
MLPNFLVIGAMKAGTTALYNYLRRHPEVFMPDNKQPNFFADQADVGTWNRGLSWYERLFEGAGGARAVGEASITYTLYPYFQGVPGRVAEVLPNVRLIYLVRNPIDRIVSHYWQRVRKGHEADRTVEEALLVNPSYLDTSRYAMQIDQYLEHFPKERMLVVKSEDMRSERELTLGRILAFLGVDAKRMPDGLVREHNRGAERRRRRPVSTGLRHVPGYRLAAAIAPAPVKRLKERMTTEEMGDPPPISDSLRREVEESLRDDVRRLRDYMPADFDGWGIA